MSKSVFGVYDQLLVCCIFLWVIRVPKQRTLQLCNPVTHHAQPVPHRHLPDPVRLDAIPTVRHFLRPARHASEVHTWGGQKSLLCFEAFEALPRAKWCYELDIADPFGVSSKGCQLTGRQGCTTTLRKRKTGKDRLCYTCCCLSWISEDCILDLFCFSHEIVPFIQIQVKWANRSWLSIFPELAASMSLRLMWGVSSQSLHSTNTNLYF